MKQKIVFVANRGFALFNSRLKLMLHLRDKCGHNVIIVCEKDKYALQMEQMGFELIGLDVFRGGGSLKKDLALFFFLSRLFW